MPRRITRARLSVRQTTRASAACSAPRPPRAGQRTRPGLRFPGLPPAIGMLGGVALLKAYSSLENARHPMWAVEGVNEFDGVLGTGDRPGTPWPLNIFAVLDKVEWDTLMFFGCSSMGCLRQSTDWERSGTWRSPRPSRSVCCGHYRQHPGRIALGGRGHRAVRFAVLHRSPDMPCRGWLLVTLTAGVGGSVLSIGSAAGVALMGQARAHPRWTWAIALDCLCSGATHLTLNAELL